MSEAKKDDKEHFTRLFNISLKVYELGEDVVCSKLKISRTTFNRWVAGVSAPHTRGQSAVFNALDELGNTPTKEV